MPEIVHLRTLDVLMRHLLQFALYSVEDGQRLFALGASRQRQSILAGAYREDMDVAEATMLCLDAATGGASQRPQSASRRPAGLIDAGTKVPAAVIAAKNGAAGKD